MGLQGDLSEISIGEIIQTLSLNGHEGTLRIQAETGEKLFYLSKGSAQLIVPGKKSTRIGEALVRTQRITQEQLERALAEQAKVSTNVLGKVLVSSGLVTDDDIAAVMRQQFRDEFFELFLLEKGRFEFLFGVPPEKLVPVDEEFSRVSLDTAGLVMEALRQIDEWQEITKEIATPRAIFKATGDLAAAAEGRPPEVRQAILLIDGRRTVDDVIFESGATKFDVYSAIYELLTEGLVRPLTHQECREAGTFAETNGDTRGASAYYDFGLVLDPTDIELRQRAFKLAKRFALFDEAKASALEIADWHAEKGAFEEALQFYLEAQACDEKDIRAAEGVFRSYVSLENPARASKALDELLKLAHRARDFARAKGALTAMLALTPESRKRRVELGDVLAEEGRKKEALKAYEAALAIDPSRADTGSHPVSEICRKILAIDPKRTDVKALLQSSVSEEERAARRKRRFSTLVYVAAVPLIVTALVGGRELLARREFDSAIAASGDPQRLPESIERLKYVAQRFTLTSVAKEAGLRAAELEGQLKRYEEEQRARAEVARNRQKEEELRRRRAEVDALVRHARFMEKKGDLRDAAAAYFEIVRDHPDIAAERKVLIPIPVTSDPAGARVFYGEEDVGVTPCVIYAEPKKEATLRIERAGFAAREATVLVDRYVEVRVDLERVPVWTHKIDAGADAAPAVANGKCFVAARDGEVRALDAATGKPLWRTRIGEWGDAISSPAPIAGKLFLATSERRIVALDQGSGRALFLVDAPGIVRGEPRGALEERLLVFGAAQGLVRFARTADGGRLLDIETGSRLDAAVAVGASAVYVAARDGSVRALSLPKGEKLWTASADDGVIGAPAIAGDVLVLGTAGGKVLALGAKDGKRRWAVETAGRVRAPIVAAGDTVFAAGEDGRLLAIDPATGSVRASYQASAPIFGAPAVGERAVYALATDGTLAALHRKTLDQLWQQKLGASAHAAPVAGGGRVFTVTLEGVVSAFVE